MLPESRACHLSSSAPTRSSSSSAKFSATPGTLDGQYAVAAVVRGVDHGAEGLPAVVEAVPAHRAHPSWSSHTGSTYSEYVPRPGVCKADTPVTSPTPRTPFEPAHPYTPGMTRSHAEKLLTSLPKVAGGSRRAQYSASTKRALIDVATSAVRGARVRRHQPGRDRRRRAGHQGRALPPLQRQAGRLRGRLRQGRGRRLQDHQGSRCAAPTTRGRRPARGCAPS